MTGLGNTIAMAFDDAVRAKTLVADTRARRALQEDPDRMLRLFALHGHEIESSGVRAARTERRFLAVRTMGQLRQSGSAL
jgi:hypothetical protein